MAIRRIASNTRAEHARVGIVLSRFNAEIGEILLKGALRALNEAGVAEAAIAVVTVPGALETPLALQRMAQTGDYDALVALGAVIRGETYHFEIVANESAAGVPRRRATMRCLRRSRWPTRSPRSMTSDEEQPPARPRVRIAGNLSVAAGRNGSGSHPRAACRVQWVCQVRHGILRRTVAWRHGRVRHARRRVCALP